MLWCNSCNEAVNLNNCVVKRVHIQDDEYVNTLLCPKCGSEVDMDADRCACGAWKSPIDGQDYCPDCIDVAQKAVQIAKEIIIKYTNLSEPADVDDILLSIIE